MKSSIIVILFIVMCSINAKAQQQDFVKVNGVCDFYETFFLPVDTDLPDSITIAMFKTILIKSECKSLENYTIQYSAVPVFVFSNNEIYYVTVNKITKMNSSDMIQPFGNDYEKKVIIAK